MIKQTIFLFIFSILLIGCANSQQKLSQRGEYLLFEQHHNFAFPTTALHHSKQFFTLQDKQKVSHFYIDIIKSTNLHAKAFYNNEQKVLQKNCSTLSSHVYEDNDTTLVWQQTCDNKLSNKAQYTIYKTIKSADNFYVIKRRWIESQPNSQTVEAWLEYLEDIEVYNN